MTSASGSDEAAAVAAMFKAQTDVWEETQEKMSQLVSPSESPIFDKIYAKLNLIHQGGTDLQ